MDRTSTRARTASGFAAALAEARRAAGLTQEALARDAGVGLRTVQELERGAARPRRETLRRLCDALGLPLEPWLGYVGARRARTTRLPRPDSTLPFPRTMLVDRRDELQAGLDLLAAARLLTLTGPGGVGKTRLAVELAGRVSADRVCWVELNGRVAASPLAALALQLHVRAPAGRDLLGPVAEVLAAAPSPLVVLDGCEHALDECVAAVGALLDACPAARMVCTSRRPLRMYGEAVLQVPPLAVSGDADAPALRLFRERSRLVRPALELADPETRTLVAEICGRLDGLPLSIELAAAATAELSLEELAERVRGDALSLEGWRDSATRHRSLRDVLAWSHDLLAPAEQALLRRLAVFEGSFAVDAAASVSAGGIVDPDAVPELLRRLLDASLVAPADPGRFRLLDTVRDYADERLRSSGEQDDTRLRHLAFFADQAARATPLLQGPEQQRWLRRLDDDLPNILAAADWSAEAGPERERRLVLALPMLSSIWRYWFQSGSCTEGYGRLRALLAATGPPPWTNGLRLARASGLGGACVLAMHLGDAETALRLGEESHALQDADGHDGRADCVALALGMIRLARGEPALARPLLEEAIADGDRRGDQEVRAFSRLSLGRALAALGHRRAGERHTADALAVFEETGDAWGAASALHDLGVAARGSDLERAAELLEQSVTRFRDHGDRGWHAQALADLGRTRHLQGDALTAIELLEESERLATEAGYREGALERSRYLASARFDAGDRAGAVAGWTAGATAAATAAHAAALGEHLATAAGWLATVGAHEEAVELLSAAASLRREAGIAGSVEDRRASARTLDLARRQEHGAAAWRRGRTTAGRDACARAAALLATYLG